jgi:hypothetical protein
MVPPKGMWQHLLLLLLPQVAELALQWQHPPLQRRLRKVAVAVPAARVGGAVVG